MVETLHTSIGFDWLHDFVARDGDDPRVKEAHDWIIGSDKLFVAASGVNDRRHVEDGYRNALELFEELAAADPDNLNWQNGIAVCRDRIGDVQRAQGDLAAALESAEASFAIAKRLAESDPGNAKWQGNLAASFITNPSHKYVSY
jgi:tetratricopeptide (TPR) repeat protein